VDRLDPELGYPVWHEDGEADYGAVYRGTGRGFMDFTCAVHAKMNAHSHQVTNIVIELTGDTAASEAYVTATVRMMEAGTLKQLMVWGRYLDRWSFRGGRWGIDKRVYLDDFSEMRDVVPAGVETGRRDRTDASYTVLANPG
jgi:hypothetical protein